MKKNRKQLRPRDLGYYTNEMGPMISSGQLKDCKIYADRYEPLHDMPNHLIYAEVGVAYGEYSQQILNIMNPKEMHLIDVYKKSLVTMSFGEEKIS